MPTGGKVVAGSATITSSQTATSATMNINQTSQRAVINWNTFNVGQNATVNFNQPNSGAVTLNRVTSASPSIVEGAIRANGQVMLVNPNGVNFGKGAEVHAAGVVASTLDINNKDFMEGRSTFAGNGQGKIVNEGKIVATDPNGYIALLAPEVRNEGYLLARKGAGSTIALASGEKITLDFRGTQLIRVSVDVATYKGLIENKRVIETNGGLVVLAAGTARELMSSLIQNTGRIAANAIVDNGGVIDIVASTVNQAGTVSANGNGANSTGGQINIVGENITLAANSKTTATGKAGGGTIEVGVGRTLATNVAVATPANTASAQTATQILASNPQAANQQAKTVTVEEAASVNTSAITQGNGGSIVIWSQVKTVVNGVLSAVGGYLNGNGGMVETSSAGSVVLGKNLSVTTAAPKGKSGLWFLDPIDLTIDSSAASVISAALTNNNVSIAVNGNVCPSLGACTQNGSGSLTIASGANILKESGSLTTLTLTSSGIFNLNADISGQNLNVIINSSIAYLNVGSTINANQVTVQAQAVYSYGNINAGNSSNLGSAIQLLASAIYVSGGLQVGTNQANSTNSNSSSNTISYNGTLIRQEDLPHYLAAANQASINLDQVYSTTAANQSSYTSTATNQITLTGTDSITISATAQILANGTFGGSISASAAQINLLAPSQSNAQITQGSGSLIQANGNNGPGGIIALTAANDFNINTATISANGTTDGGSIRLITSAGNLLLSNSLIQTNGGTGRGGSLGVSAANDTTIHSSTLEATGFTKGGSIMVGYDSAGKSIPFSQSTTLDAATILNASQTDGADSTGGGLIETSGGTVTQLASINAGRGGMWLLDPYDYTIDTAAAGSIQSALNQGISVSLSTSDPTKTFNGVTLNGADLNGISQGNIYVTSAINAATGGGALSLTGNLIYIYASISTLGGQSYVASQSIFVNSPTNTLIANAPLTFTAPSIVMGASINTRGNLTFNGNLVILGSPTLNTNGYNLAVTGVTSGGLALGIYAQGQWSLLSNGLVVLQGSLVGQSSTGSSPTDPNAVNGIIPGGVLTYLGTSSNASNYTYTPTFSSLSSVLIVGGGGGGGSASGGNNVYGTGGGGGGVFTADVTLAATSHSISVGLGGQGGNTASTTGGSGGVSSMVGGSVPLSVAYGGSGGGAAGVVNYQYYGMGGSARAGALSAIDKNGADGVRSEITGSTLYYGGGGGGGGGGGATSYPQAPQYYGFGGIASTRQDGQNNIPPGQCVACDRNGNPGRPDTGMGGGGGNTGPYTGTGGAGGSGAVILQLLGGSSNGLGLNNIGTLNLQAVQGKGSAGSALASLNISLGGNSKNSTIAGAINGTISLSLDSYGSGNVLSLSGWNQYVGAFTVYGGTLRVDSDQPFGNGTNIVEIPVTGTTVDAPTIDLNGRTLYGYTLNIQGLGKDAKGALINSSSTTANFNGAVNLSNVTFIGGAGSGNGEGSIYLNGIVNANGYGLGFVNYANIYLGNSANQIATIAGTSMAILQLRSASNVTIGTVNDLVNGSRAFNGPTLTGLTFAINSGSYLLINLPSNILAVNSSISAAAIYLTASNASSGAAISMSGNNSITSTGGLGVFITSLAGDISLGTSTITNNNSSCCTPSTSMIEVKSAGNVALGNLVNSAPGGIRVTAGKDLNAGNSGGSSITALGTISNSAGVVGLSTSSPNANSGLASSIENAAGLTRALASVGRNVQYGMAGGVFTNASAYTGGNFINYRANDTAVYNVSLGTNYSAVYGQAYTSTEANAWLATNASVSIGGTGFGYSTTVALANLRFSSSIDGVISSNLAQNATPIISSSLVSNDGKTVSVTGTQRTYKIDKAPLGVEVTGEYNGTTTIAPTSFTITGGLKFSDSINSITSATVSGADVGNANNYVTGITIGSGSASMNNYQLNIYGRYNGPDPSLQSAATVTPKNVTISGAIANNKYYDGNITATFNLDSATIVGKVVGDALGISMAGSFANQNASPNDIAVTPVAALTGDKAINYNLIQPTGFTAKINPKYLNLSATKVFDGTTNLDGFINFNNSLIGNETLNYTAAANSRNVNDARYISSLTLSDGLNGGKASNYAAPTLNSQYTWNNVSITKAPLGVTLTGSYNSTYNFATVPNVYGLGIGDTIESISSATFAYKNVADNARNYVTAITIGSGTASMSNYTLNAVRTDTAPNNNLLNTANLIKMNVSITGGTASNKVYDGTTAAVVSGTAQGIILGDDAQMVLTTGDFANANVGTRIMVTPTGYLTGGAAGNYNLLNYVPGGLWANITPAPLGISISATYSGSNVFANSNFGVAGMVNNETITGLGQVTLANANVSANGSNYVTAFTITGGTALASNYIINPGYFGTPGPTNNMATVNARVLTLSAAKVYDGSTNLTGAVTLGNLVGNQTLTYAAATANSPNVVGASYINAITIGDGTNGGLASNYTYLPLTAVTAPLTITPKAVTLSATKVYDGTTSLAGAVTITGLVGNQTLNYTATANSANVVGASYISAINLADGTLGGIASNYALPTLSAAYAPASITAKSLNLSATRPYDGTTSLTGAVTINGLVGNETLNYSGATANSANVVGASYISAITIADGTNGGLASNYLAPTLNSAYTYNNVAIAAKLLTLTFGSASKVYDGTTTISSPVTIGGLIGNETLNYSGVTAFSANVTTANNYIAAITLANGSNGGVVSNYVLPVLNATTAPITISARPLTITPSAQTKVYGEVLASTSNSDDGTNTATQTVNYLNGVATNSYQGFSVAGWVGSNPVSTVTLSSTGALATSGITTGSNIYSITASGAAGTGLGNYSIQYESNNYSTLTVTPRPLYVTVANASMSYGAAALPNFTSTVNGLVNGDQANVTLATTASPYNRSAGSASNVGSYAITANSVSNANYSLVTTNGSLTVTPITLTVSANTQGGPGSPIIYGTPTVLSQGSDALSSIGLVNGDSISGATITYNNSQNVSGASAAGAYTGGLQISNARGTGLSNYTILYQPGNLIISKALLTITPVNDAKLIGQLDALGYNGLLYSGFKNGETSTALDLTNATITRSNAGVESVGTYTGVLQVTGINSANYGITYAPGNYTIIGAGQLLVRINSGMLEYGSAPTNIVSTAAYVPTSVINPGPNSAVQLSSTVNFANLASTGIATVTDGTSSMNVNLAIANPVYSTSGALAVGAYNLISTPQTVPNGNFTGLFNSAIAVSGVSVTPKTLSFANFNVSGISKVYDGNTSMSTGFAAGNIVFIARDLVSTTAKGSYVDRNVGTNKAYTIGVTFDGVDAPNYVMSGGGIYVADGGNQTDHGPANGVITLLNSVTYVGSTTGGSWSDPNSWRVSNGTALGAIPDLANVANVIVPIATSVVYDSGVVGPVRTNIANAGNVTFNLGSPDTIDMNIAGTGTVTVAGTGAITLAGVNSYSGNTIVNNGATLIAGVANALGSSAIQGLGGSFGVSPGVVLSQLTTSGSLKIISDITTNGNQTYGDVAISKVGVTSLISNLGNIVFNGLLDGNQSKSNSLLVQTPNGTVTFNKSVGSVLPLNVLEVDSQATFINADVLTADQQNYCGIGGCYTPITPAQLSENYCGGGGDCYSKNTSTLAYNLVAAKTNGDYVKSAAVGQVFIGDTGQVGFLYNTYSAYSTSVFNSAPVLFQNNPVFARTLISRDPMVNFGSYVSDASANATHTMQVAAIQTPGVASPTVQLNGSGKTQNTSALYSLSALTQSVGTTNTLTGLIKTAAKSVLETFKNISLGSGTIGLSDVTVITPTLNVAVPVITGLNAAGASITVNTANLNGRSINAITGAKAFTPYNPPANTAGTTATVSSSRNSFIMSSVSQQTKLERKYSVEASVDVGDIETDDRPADKEKDEEERKKKNNGKAS
nr:YDG domain-containing protein [Polynucleobacter nymphae]